MSPSRDILGEGHFMALTDSVLILTFHLVLYLCCARFVTVLWDPHFASSEG